MRIEGTIGITPVPFNKRINFLRLFAYYACFTRFYLINVKKSDILTEEGGRFGHPLVTTKQLL